MSDACLELCGSFITHGNIFLGALFVDVLLQAEFLSEPLLTSFSFWICPYLAPSTASVLTHPLCHCHQKAFTYMIIPPLFFTLNICNFKSKMAETNWEVKLVFIFKRL